MGKTGIRNTVTILFIAFVFNLPLLCRGKNKGKKVSVLPVPAIGYSPETRTYIGAVSLFTFNFADDTLTRTSNAKVEFNYTWNRQIIAETGWNYFSPEENWFTRGLLHFSKYPDLYYGIGFNTPEKNEVSFQSNRLIIENDVFRNLGNNWFLGAGVNFTSYAKIRYLDEGSLYPELTDSRSIGAGIFLLKDTRDNILSPEEGSFLELGSSFNFSQSSYSVTTFDLRKYFGFGNPGNPVLAGRLYHSSVWGEPPFYGFPEMGGDKLARGYFKGRFRDKNLSSLQLEIRSRIYRRLGLAAFGGISIIYGELNRVANESFKPNAGIGLRFLVDRKENTNLRIDYAAGIDGQSGLYIGFGEAF